jgi:hypothetical protein
MMSSEAGQPPADEASRRSRPREKRGNENVRVEQRPHGLRATGLLLGRDGEPHRLVLVEVGGRPDPLEQV